MRNDCLYIKRRTITYPLHSRSTIPPATVDYPIRFYARFLPVVETGMAEKLSVGNIPARWTSQSSAQCLLTPLRIGWWVYLLLSLELFLFFFSPLSPLA